MSTRSNIAKLKRLLRARNVDLLRTGIHLACALADGEVVSALLDGTEYDPIIGKITPGRAFASLPKKALHHARIATLGLISTGLGTIARDLRVRIRYIAIDGVYESSSHRLIESDPKTPLDVSLIGELPIRVLVVRGIELIELEALDQLRELEVLHVPRAPAETLGRLPKLRELGTRLGGRIATLPAAERILLQADGPIALEHAPSLTALTISTPCEELRLTHAPRLEMLDIQHTDQLITHEPLASLRRARLAGPIRNPSHFPNLEQLRTCSSLEGIEALPALRSLSVAYHGAAPHSLSPLRGMPLEHFRCDERALKTLDGHPRADAREHLDLRSLRSLAGLEIVRGVERLTLGPELTSLRGIEVLRDTLRGVDLRYCRGLRDVSALAGMDMRAIMIAGTRFEIEDFPEELQWAVVFDRRSRFESMVKRERSAIEIATPVDAIEALVRDPNIDTVNRAADLIRDANDPAITDHFLYKTSIRSGDIRPGPNAGKGGARTNAVRRHFVRRVLAEAPSGSRLAPKICARIQSLTIIEVRSDPRFISPHEDCPVDLSPLPAFPALSTLRVRGRLTHQQLEPLGRCSALQDVELDATATDLSWLARSKGLRRLVVRGSKLESLQGIADASALESLEAPGAVASLEPLRAKARLHTLRTGVAPHTDLEPLTSVRGLSNLALKVPQCALAPLAELPALTHVTLHQASGPLALPVAIDARIDGAFPSLAGLVAPRLQTLWFQGQTMKAVDAENLTSLKRLDLTFNSLERIGGLPPGLQALSLLAKPAAKVDLSSIAAHRALRVLQLDQIETPSFEWLIGSTLRALSVLRTRVDDLAALRELRSLEGLYLHFTDSWLDLRPLIDHPSLKRFVVPREDVVDYDALPESLRRLASSNYMWEKQYLDG